MSGKIKSEKTLVEIIESIFNISLTNKEVKKFDPSPQLLHDLSLAIQDYYHSYQIPQKEPWELRPYISPQFTPGRSLGLGYEFNPKHFDEEFKYTFDPSITGEMVRNVKKYLLYCHSLCIHDPLPYLLDYFRLSPKSDVACARLPAVRNLLSEYAELERLIRRRILIPLSDEVFGFYSINDIELTQEEKNVLESKIPGLSKIAVVLLCNAIRKEQFKAKKLKHNIDLFFPHHDYVTVLKELLRLSEAQFTSREVQEPFNVGILGHISTINPDVVSLDDFLRIRANEELFCEWRNFLGQVFQRLYTRQEDYTDLEREFREAVQDELFQWKDKLKEKKKKSSVLNQMFEAADKAMIGFIAGALTGLVTAAPPDAIPGALIGGTIGGGMGPAVEFVRNLIRVAWNRPNTLSLRHHFLALGLE